MQLLAALLGLVGVFFGLSPDQIPNLPYRITDQATITKIVCPDGPKEGWNCNVPVVWDTEMIYLLKDHDFSEDRAGASLYAHYAAHHIQLNVLEGSDKEKFIEKQDLYEKQANAVETYILRLLKEETPGTKINYEQISRKNSLVEKHSQLRW